MAKKSAVEKNEHRRKLVKNYSGKRTRLKALINDKELPIEERFAAGSSVELTVRAGEAETRAVLDGLEGLSASCTEEDGRCHVVLSGAGDADALCERLFFAFAAAKKPIVRLSVSKASLEDVFLELTADDAAAPEAPAKEAEQK